MLFVSARFRIVPVTREKLTRAIETKNKVDIFYQSGSCPAEEKYTLADGIKFIHTPNFSKHTSNYNHLTKENNLFQKIFKNSSLRSLLNSFKEEWNPADAGGMMEKFKPGSLEYSGYACKKSLNRKGWKHSPHWNFLHGAGFLFCSLKWFKDRYCYLQ